MMNKITTVINYFEMTEYPLSHMPVCPIQKVELTRAVNPTVSFYRYLYNTVGKDWLWYERRQLSDTELLAIIHDEKVEIYVLYVNGVPAGYSELDRNDVKSVAISYFGLFPEFIGKGLGGYFLRRMVDLAWDDRTQRIFLHTCSEDHPSAARNYVRNGFAQYRQQIKEIDDPRSIIS